MIELDVHTHLAPIDPEGLARFDGIAWNPDQQVLTVDGHAVGLKGLFDPRRLMAHLDAKGVRRAFISIPPPLYRQQLDATEALAWCRYANQGLATIARRSAGRLGALFHLPMEHPGLFEALFDDFDAGGFEGLAIAAGGRPDIVYSSEVYLPLWSWLNARAAFVFMHPGACEDPRLAGFYLENLLGNPVETGIAASHLVMAGIPARHPAIRFCLAHAGGIFSTLVGRLERGFDTTRPGVDLASERPLQAARRFYVDCIAHHPDALLLARRVFGETHVLHGSDWPFPMGLPDAPTPSST